MGPVAAPAFSSPELAIAGLLEPAYFVAGDAFDYSLNGEILGFAILDAMGHGVTRRWPARWPSAASATGDAGASS